MSRAPGIIREHAASALLAGWGREPLLRLHELCRERDWSAEPAGSAFLVRTLSGAGVFLVYRTHTVFEIERLVWSPATNTTVTAYTDGSGNTAKTPAGIGCVIYDTSLSQPIMIAQNIGLGTNNRAELCAIWAALRAYPYVDQEIKIFSDSMYAIGALTQDWARNANAQLIANIRADIGARSPECITFEHVDGHKGHEGNEVADCLADIGRKLVTVVTPYEG